jgi:hypothetical protein
MKLAIMQPYFLPYVGYFQLISSVDQFIIYDNIKYTKKSWINRNRMLLNSTDTMFSLPLKKGSDSLTVVERELATEFDRIKLLNQIKGAYGRSPYFKSTFTMLENIVCFEQSNLFHYIHNSIVRLCEYLGIQTQIVISSGIAIDHNLKSQDKVLALCQASGATTYINPIGGLELYSKEDFSASGVTLQFIKSRPFEYPQFGATFLPWLSIVDVLMFNSIGAVRTCIASNYEIIK